MLWRAYCNGVPLVAWGTVLLTKLSTVLGGGGLAVKIWRKRANVISCAKKTCDFS